MQARGPLMIEHRLIEKMLAIIEEALAGIEANQRIDPLLVDAVVDFIRIYADQTHHGKEEDILFRQMDQKPLSAQDRRMMEDLIEDHKLGRRTVAALDQANTRYRGGDGAALPDIAESLRALVDFYPPHIEKEDKVFFPAARAYFTEEEDAAMLAQFREFDQRMIHEKYQSLVAELKA